MRASFKTLLTLPRWLLALGVAVLVYDSMLVRFGFPIELLEGRVFYEPREIGAVLWKIGDAGRARYMLVNRFDVAFIWLYTVFFLSLAWHWRRHGFAFWAAAVFSVLTSLFDLGESLGIRYLLDSFPAADAPVEMLVSRCTTLKWFSLAGLAVSFFMLWSAARKKKSVPDAELLLRD